MPGPLLNVSILGTGMALVHLHHPSLASLPHQYKIHSVMERTPRGRAQEACGESIKVVTAIQEVVDDPEVDLVVVASPNNTHYEYTKSAILANKHVLVEKPLCPTASQAQELVDLAKRQGVILSVYQNRRWDSDFLTVKKLLKEGTLGPINEFQSNYDRYRPLPPTFSRDTNSNWKETPGEHNDVIYNLGSHIIDQAYVLFGKPERVGCRCWDQRGIGLDEAFVMDLYYPPPNPTSSPLHVTLRASIMSPLPKQLRFQIKGSRGTFIKHGLDPQGDFREELARGKRVEDVPGYGVEKEEDWGTVWVAEEERDGAVFRSEVIKSEPGNYPALYSNLYDAITSKDPGRLAVKPEEAVQVLRLIELGVRSSREGRVLDV